MKNLISKRLTHTPINHSSETFSFVIQDLQKTIQPLNCLSQTVSCSCDMCLQKHNQFKEKADGNLFKTSTTQSSSWLKMILDGLCLSGAKTLKLYLPDILFVQDDNLQIFRTSRKDGRIVKLTNNVSLKTMYPMTVRLRKQYKTLLQQNFNEKMLDNIDPQLMHVTYFDKYVPSYFHDGMKNLKLLNKNKSQFKKYILHKSKKYEIQKLQEHKMNDKQPFCIIKYKDGNCQLFNQKEFNVYSLSLISKLQEEIIYVQSYIKYKLQTQAIYYSEYTYQSSNVDLEMDKCAEDEVITLIGGKNKFDAKCKHDIQTSEEVAHEMMILSPREYVKLMTYKIIHYLNMTSRVYIEHIKIKWITNDIGNIYLQEIMEFSSGDVPRKLIKYRLPPKDQSADSYHYSQDFIEHYKDLKRRKAINTQKIKKNLQDKSYEEVIKMMFPDSQIANNNSVQEKYKMEYVPLVRKGKGIQRDNKKIRKEEVQAGNNKSFNKDSSQSHKFNFRRSVKTSKFQSFLVKNSTLETRQSKRSKSINLDKWKNAHLYNKKQNIEAQINRYFTINQSDQQQKIKRSGKDCSSIKSQMDINNEDHANKSPNKFKTSLTMYRTTISFHNENNRENHQKSKSRYNNSQKTFNLT